MCRQFGAFLRPAFVSLAMLLALAAVSSGQNNNNNNNNNNNGDTGGIQSGIAVDARGVVEMRSFADPTGMLMRQQAAAARQSLSRDVLAFSKLRKISLNRLEQALREKNGVLTDEMKYLAGLLRVRYVFYYPETKDIVIAGPAEGWAADGTGRVVGISTGRPVVQLQDLVVALRAYPPGKKGTEAITCSIDPTQEGLASLQRFLRSVGSTATPDQTQFLVEGLRNSLGPQTVSIGGIPASTHFAMVMVEADYRMKLIGIGLERPPVKMTSFVERTNPAAVSRNALFRWYFVPDYNCVRVSENRQAMELVGDGVKLIGEDELVTGSGQRSQVGASNKASKAFTLSFTQRYPELAARSPVYAELRNLIDLSVAAAYIQKEDFYGKAGWKMDLLGDEKALPVQTYNAPKMVGSAVAAIWKGNRLMTPIGGGVRIEPTEAVQSGNLMRDEDDKVSGLHAQVKDSLPQGRWWWD